MQNEFEPITKWHSNGERRVGVFITVILTEFGKAFPCFWIVIKVKVKLICLQ